MRSGYIYFSNDEMRQLKGILSKSKDPEALGILDKIFYYERNLDNNDLTVLAQAKEKFCDDSEDVMIDEDAIVSTTKTGSYVHAWLWIDAKTRKRRKKAENE